MGSVMATVSVRRCDACLGHGMAEPIRVEFPEGNARLDLCIDCQAKMTISEIRSTSFYTERNQRQSQVRLLRVADIDSLPPEVPPSNLSPQNPARVG